jgi:cob(I)alamin adenosyltransferase
METQKTKQEEITYRENCIKWIEEDITAWEKELERINRHLKQANERLVAEKRWLRHSQYDLMKGLEY